MDDIDGAAILKKIERCGRVAYKSEDKITEGSAEKFVRMIIKSGHESVIEHVSLTVKFICDRGVTHELVRHRICAFTQESTRYCNYSKNGLTVILPYFWQGEAQLEQWNTWMVTTQAAEMAYDKLIHLGATPQEARSVLPNSTKTEIVVTANLREWRHILKLRCAPAAHPQMRQLMIPLLKELKGFVPVIFDDIEEPAG
jgi:thymidylate synthase (FAD)